MRMFLIAPVVDPAHPPKNIRMNKNHIEDEGQISKLVVVYPVPVLIEIV